MIDAEVIDSAIQVVLPHVGTGAAEQVGELGTHTAATAFALAARRVIGKLRPRLPGGSPDPERIRELIEELAQDSAFAKDLIVLAGGRIIEVNRDLYHFEGDGPVHVGDGDQVGGDKYVVDLEATDSTIRFGSQRG